MRLAALSFAARRRVWRGLAASLVGGAWAALGYGLFATPDEHAWGELEAGGRFAANMSVYWPYFALTLPIAVVVVLGLLRKTDVLSPLWATTPVIAVFALWVATVDFLFDAQPQLWASILWCLTADAAAVGALAIALVVGDPDD